MYPFSSLLQGISRSGDEFTTTVPDDWLQGRTLYGGLSAALCVETAVRAFDELPPLRSAQFSFVGPATGAIRLVPSILRKGKSTVFVAVDLIGETGLATRAALCFCASRDSSLAFHDNRMPQVPAPESCESFFGGEAAPTFAKHFDGMLAGGVRPVSGVSEPEFLVWLRHKDQTPTDFAVALTAIADALPPAAMAMFTARAPISTVNWTFDLLAQTVADDDGWRLVQARAEEVSNGYSSQSLSVWSSRGEALMLGRQCVALWA